MVLKVQAPILQKYGQPPNAQGVELMKHTVQRRVAEGFTRIEELANEARRTLGLDTMPDRKASAEQVLAAKVDETSATLGLGLGLPAEAEITKLCLQRIQAEQKSGQLPAASAAILEQFLGIGVEEGCEEVYRPSVFSLLKMAKLGITASDLQGCDVPTEVPVLAAPSQAEFFEAHVLPNRPAVLRGVFDADRFPPLRDLSDPEFLRRRCGHRRVLVKSLAHEDSDGRPVFVSDPELQLPLAAFLDSLEAHERSGSRVPFYLGKVPLQKEMPELAEEVAQAPTCPQREYGACFGDHIKEGVFTYFGCGRNTTAVHFDAHENLQLCLCGTKRLWLYPPSDARYLYPCNDFSRSAVVPFARFEELSEEFRAKYALVSQARPLEVKLGPGDLLYLPSCWWHCVEGSESRNMILVWWFCLHPDKKARAGLSAAGATGHSVAAA